MNTELAKGLYKHKSAVELAGHRRLAADKAKPKVIYCFVLQTYRR